MHSRGGGSHGQSSRLPADRNRTAGSGFTPGLSVVDRCLQRHAEWLAVLDGVSLSQQDDLGSRIAVPFLSLHDDGLHPDNIGAAPFDGEGTPTQRLSLIEGGV